MGGSVGLTSKSFLIAACSTLRTNSHPVSGTVLNNILNNRLRGTLDPLELKTITSSAYAIKTLNLTNAQYEAVIDSYMAGIHTNFIIYVPLIGIAWICACLIKDRGVAEKDAKPEPPAPEARDPDLSSTPSSRTSLDKDGAEKTKEDFKAEETSKA